MRVSISKPQHLALLDTVCKQLGSDKPIDGIEHILNCWLVGNIPASTVLSTSPIETSGRSDVEPTDDYSELMEF